MQKITKTIFFLLIATLFFNMAHFEGAKMLSNKPFTAFAKASSNK